MFLRRGILMPVVLAVLVCAMPATGRAADKPVPPVVPGPPGKAQVPKGPRAIIKTKFGDIEIKFLPDVAPKHVESFIKLARSGFYNGTIFHRVIPNFMIQGGDPNTKDYRKKDSYGQGGPLDEKGKPVTLPGEFSETPHLRGIVSMARRGERSKNDIEAFNSAGSQFFIVVEDSRFLDRKYTAFGQVARGMGVADKIVNEPRVMCDRAGPTGQPEPNPPGQGPCDNPLQRIEITVTIVE